MSPGSHYRSRSGDLVRRLSERQAVRRRETAVGPVLPDIRERPGVWDRQYDLPFGGAAGTLTAVPLCRPGEAGITVVATETALGVPVAESRLGFLDRYRAPDHATAGNPPVDS